MVISLIAISTAKISQASQSSLASSKIALQAQQYANAEAEIIKATKYTDLKAQGKTNINSDYAKEILLSEETPYNDEIKQRTATVKIYKGNEVLPRYSLDVIRLSAEKSSGVPIGTIIAWASSKNPSDGTWLECNGQSCAAYPALRNVLGKSTVPDYRNRFLEGSSTPGTILEAGLPNITGHGNTGAEYWDGNNLTGGGAITVTYNYSGTRNTNHGNSKQRTQFKFDASLSNAIYGKSHTVQPPAVTVRYLIKAA